FQDSVLRQWVEECGLFIEELLCWEGRGHFTSDLCSKCGINSAMYECIDCRDRELCCRECMVMTHSKWYLHRIRKWNGEFFEKSSLRELGLRIQLGKPGHRCSRKTTAPEDDFVIIDIKGIHQVNLDFCACGEDEQRHIVQLLRAGLFPASIQHPQTAATFDVLDHFELLTFVSQLSGFEYYQALVRKTCNTGLNPPKDRYLVFLRMTHEWRHLHLLMRSGQGHDPMGAIAILEGAMALLCPACPHPGINMPDGWESSTKPYVHSLFLAIDANFRLKRKNISDPLDPGLVKGGAYFVEDTKYRAHLQAKEKEKDPRSTCSRHDAVNLSASRGNQGHHAASGVGKVCCARHDMHLPNSIGDLQVGERYANMDYLFYKTVSTLRKPISYVVSYDIACQWSVHLRKRLLDLDAEFFIYDSDHAIQFLVPKFHLPAHIAPCRRRFSFNYRQGVGRTDGEAPERGWPVTNALAGSTREMCAGTRRDVLEYQFGDHNWVKITNLASLLKRRLFTAAIDMAEHTIEYNDLSSTIPESELKVWIMELEKWEADPDNHPYPFEPEASEGPTLASVRLELAEAEERDLKSGKDTSLHDEVSPSIFIDLGVTIENKQRAVKKEVSELWTHAQDRQKTKVLLNTNTLQREIDNWLEYQKLYCPGAERIKEKVLSNRRGELKSYDYPLLLPSALKGKIPIDEQLILLEAKLRQGQAHEALARLRSELQIRYHIWWAKNRNTRGQAAGTRASKVLDAANERINAAGAEYNTAYSALVLLSPTESSMENLQVLEKGDMRHISEPAIGQTQGTHTLSWIWTAGAPRMRKESVPDVKYEWGKCRARMTRFGEEIHLGMAEMDRTKRYHQHQSRTWQDRALLFNGWGNKERTLAEGLRAYALKKARLFSDLEKNCDRLWTDLPAHIARMHEVIKNPDHASSTEFAKSSSSKAKAKAQRKAGRLGGNSDVNMLEENAGNARDEDGRGLMDNEMTVD
ncbi:hypothetical protein BJ165DRAFT_1352555, partial [Panaeolus papilionaceus]